MSNDVIPAPAEKPKVTHIGYARISTEDQKMDLQIDALKKAGCQDMHIFRERASGSSTVRPELGLCLKTLREGDVLTVYKLDRLGRNMKELIRIVEWLEENKIGFYSITENIDTTTPSGKFFFHIFGAVAQFERDIISERTKAGLAAARRRGRVGGRKPKLNESQAKQAIDLLVKNPDLTQEQAARMLGTTRATLHRAWARHKISPPDSYRLPGPRPDDDKRGD